MSVRASLQEELAFEKHRSVRAATLGSGTSVSVGSGGM
jgi:hypothetical protein